MADLQVRRGRRFRPVESNLSVPHAIDESKQNSPGRQPAGALYTYLPDGVTFVSQKAPCLRTIYFPLCGIDAGGIKSAITPRLAGDIKIDKNRYLTKPVSAEDLRQNSRNFFCRVEGFGIVSIAGGNEKDAFVEAGMFWHKLVRAHPAAGLETTALNFVPVTGERVELMRVTVRNVSGEKRVVTPIFGLPVFGRALANKHDHEHVTSLLNRIAQLPAGVCVEPTMIFDERGHRPNTTVYYVLGADDEGKNPAGTFPTAESFYGDGGDVFAPAAVTGNTVPAALPEKALRGKEAVGALRFAEGELAPGASKEYLIVMGVGSGREEMRAVFGRFNSPEKFDAALERNTAYWSEKSRAICFSTGDAPFDAWMRWVGVQPALRRIFGCSFLPDHDYGKGGRGWRDIWQDLLSPVLVEPENIRRILIDYFAGVRIDGSNATIVGSAPGEFLADRNAIARVWMDHGAWPFVTLLLYLNQTGDYDILLEENAYFRDAQLSRASENDPSWAPGGGNRLKDKNGRVYSGSIIEHVLVQHLVQFFNVGGHNITRLEGADWNDGLDMAGERGESVAFMSFYGGNLLALADLLESLSAAKGVREIVLAEEVKALLDSLTDTPVDYGDARAKREFLSATYFPSVQPSVSGAKTAVPVAEAAGDLRGKGNWIFERIRQNEKITVEDNGRTHTWFNGYYDNKGARVEGKKDGRVRMTLTGQVFPVMSGLADRGEIEGIVRAVRQHLYDEQMGGIRLNTDFGLAYYLDLGRAFGFAYGTKENGSFFNHMTVMYAYALYKRGFAREGYEVVRSVYRMCADTGRSKIYPGVPEYFDAEGRGRYHYLTGAASWLVLTRLTQAFGIRGEGGDLLLAPKLVKEEFNAETRSLQASCRFAGNKVTVTFENPGRLDYGDYTIQKVILNGGPVKFDRISKDCVKIRRNIVETAPSDCAIRVILSNPIG